MSDEVVRVEVARRNVIMVRHITVDPNEAIHGSVRSAFCTAGLTPEMWSGGKSERTRLAELGVTSEAKVDIPLFFPQEEFSTSGARIALFKEGLGYGLPYCLTPLMESAEVRKALLEKGIWWVVALGPRTKNSCSPRTTPIPYVWVCATPTSGSASALPSAGGSTAPPRSAPHNYLIRPRL